MANITFKEAIFDEVANQATDIRNKLEGAIYYGIPLDSFPNQEDAILAIAYNLHFMESLAVKVEEQTYPSCVDAGGEY